MSWSIPLGILDFIECVYLKYDWHEPTQISHSKTCSFEGKCVYDEHFPTLLIVCHGRGYIAYWFWFIFGIRVDANAILEHFSLTVVGCGCGETKSKI